MSQGNEHIVRKVIDAVNAQDFATATEFYADDVVLTIEGEASRLAGEGAVGKPAFVRWFADWFSLFETGYRFELSDVRADGDLVHATITHHARGRRSGADVTRVTRWVYELSGGKIVRCHGSDE